MVQTDLLGETLKFKRLDKECRGIVRAVYWNHDKSRLYFTIQTAHGSLTNEPAFLCTVIKEGGK